MTELTNLIKDLIRAEGPLSVARFMQVALQHPEHGYYIKGDPLGVAGDFTTAPEISQMFGELLGLWCAEVWRLMGSPEAFVWLELGPGRGTLMQDALRATQKISGFHSAMRLYLLESNVTLRALQKQKLAAFQPVHIETLEELPALPVIALANEFLDALPIHQYQRAPDGWRERKVGLVDDHLAFVQDAALSPLPLPDTFSFFEVSPLAIGVVREVARHIKYHGGAALWIDYGYKEPAGENTLQAVSGHQSVSPLTQVGHVDVTSLVDFAALRLAAEREGVFVPTLTEQGDFLRAMGIDLRSDQLAQRADELQKQALADALKRLTDPAQMGTLFKVMAMTSPPLNDLPGFP